MNKIAPQRPTAAFVGASWAALLVGVITYLAGLWNATMQLNEKGFYAISFVLSLFAAVAVQKKCARQRGQRLRRAAVRRRLMGQG